MDVHGVGVFPGIFTGLPWRWSGIAGDGLSIPDDELYTRSARCSQHLRDHACVAAALRIVCDIQRGTYPSRSVFDMWIVVRRTSLLEVRSVANPAVAALVALWPSRVDLGAQRVEALRNPVCHWCSSVQSVPSVERPHHRFARGGGLAVLGRAHAS